MKLVTGMGPLLSLARVIDDGRIEGRQIDWGAWIAPVRIEDLAATLTLLDWPAAVDVAELDRRRQYLLVGIET